MTDDEFQKRFPTRAARKAADEAIDEVDATLPMTTFVDVWIAAYAEAGGVVVGGRLG